ncbi:beta strand repeat-containing protein [Tateyamaria sp.]|uniref:beta strand repeat-containing protein n=1 Tax=Tateyamaria sp. TaxID=1929288 RepID=UPI00329B477B
MKAIDFVVRDGAGALQRGVVPGEGDTAVSLGSGQEVSFNLRQIDMAGQSRVGDDLVITLVDGRTITLENYFNDVGPTNRLFISADGYLNEVAFVETTDGELYAQFGPTEQWGKWSPSDDLIYLGGTDFADAGAVLAGDDEVTSLAAGALGGLGLLGGGGAAVAAAGGAALLVGAGGGDGDGDGGETPPAAPTVNEVGTTSNIGGDDTTTHTFDVSGTGEPGDTVEVDAGGVIETAVIGEDGTWTVTYDETNLPDDGTIVTEVTFTHEDGSETVIDGPTFVIDTIGPDVEITSGVESVGHIVNGTELSSGVTLTGTSEAGATLEITIQDITRTVTVAEDGTWSATWQAGTLVDGEYTTDVTIVASDAFGNTTTITDGLVVDTVADLTIDSNIEGDGIINAAEAADGVTLTGTAQAGSSVEVTFNGITRSATVSADGSWTVDYLASELPTGETDVAITAVATDAAGNTATANGSVNVDTLVNALSITSSSGGADGVINAVEATSGLVVTGVTEPGSTLVVTLGGATATAVVAADGTWTANFSSDAIAPGTYSTELTATATDAAGNTRSTTQAVNVDTEANLLTINGPVEGDDVINGVEASDGVVLTGNSDPGALVSVTLGGVTTQTVTNSAGVWQASFSAADIAPGTYEAEITATSTDAAGNTATTSDTVLVDTQVDVLSITSQAGGTDGVINAVEATAGLSVTGVTEPGSTLVLTLGGATVSAVVAADGSWTANFSSDAIAAGEYTTDLTATATDAAGNVRSTTQAITVDTEAGTLTINGPIEGDDLINEVEASDGVILTGNADPGALVSVTLDGVTHQTIANSAGVWQSFYSANEITPGTYEAQISATTTDAAGNTATANATVDVDTQVDNLSLAADVIEGDNVISEAERADGVVLTGTTEVGSTVVVTLGDATATAIVDANGNWQAPFTASQIPTGEYVTDVSVTATDAAGNVATVTDTVRVDTLVNQLDIQDTVTEDDVISGAEAREGISLGGQVEAGSTVMVDFNGTVLAAVVDANGNWSLEIPPSAIAPGTYDADITVMATDSVGNTDMISDTLSIDTEAPDGPVIASLTRDGDGIRGITTELSDGELVVAEVAPNGSITEVQGGQSDSQFRPETQFEFASNVPDGSNLVVTSSDDAGNTSGTFVVLDDESAGTVVELSNPLLGNYQIEAVDLQFAEEASLTITEAALVNLSDSTDALTIHGGSDDTVTIAGATLTGSTNVGGQNFDVYSLGSEGTVILDDDITVNTAIA